MVLSSPIPLSLFERTTKLVFKVRFLFLFLFLFNDITQMISYVVFTLKICYFRWILFFWGILIQNPRQNRNFPLNPCSFRGESCFLVIVIYIICWESLNYEMTIKRRMQIQGFTNY